MYIKALNTMILVSPKSHSSKRQVIDMNCNNCGFELSNTASFCPNCGTNVSDSETEFLFDKSCPHCHAPLPAGAVFCNTCGKNVDNNVIDDRICVHCGCPLKPEADFCPNCGNSVPGATRPVVPPTDYAPIPKPPVHEGKKDNSVLILIIVLILVIAIAIGVVAWLLLKPDSTPAPITPTPSPTATTTTAPTSTPTPTYAPLPTEAPASSDYLFPSDSVYITYSDLYGLSQDEVAFIRNEIYARHGYMFQTEPYKSYFAAKSWYSPNPYFDESYFNSIEKANKDFIVEYEKSMGWR